jgi:hypothetical protein
MISALGRVGKYVSGSKVLVVEVWGYLHGARGYRSMWWCKKRAVDPVLKSTKLRPILLPTTPRGSA